MIVYDPSWNPSEDDQAVARAYRIGQQREVEIFRLIGTCGVEEKMYGKQIFKDGLRRTVLEQEDAVRRYFTKDEIRKLFSLTPEGVSETLERIRETQIHKDDTQQGSPVSPISELEEEKEGRSKSPQPSRLSSSDTKNTGWEMQVSDFGSLFSTCSDKIMGITRHDQMYKLVLKEQGSQTSKTYHQTKDDGDEYPRTSQDQQQQRKKKKSGPAVYQINSTSNTVPPSWRIRPIRPYTSLPSPLKTKYHTLVDRAMYFLCQLYHLDVMGKEIGEEPFLPRFPPSIHRFLDKEGAHFHPLTAFPPRQEEGQEGQPLEDPLFIFLEALAICDESPVLHTILACLLDHHRQS